RWDWLPTARTFALCTAAWTALWQPLKSRSAGPRWRRFWPSQVRASLYAHFRTSSRSLSVPNGAAQAFEVDVEGAQPESPPATSDIEEFPDDEASTAS